MSATSTPPPVAPRGSGAVLTRVIAILVAALVIVASGVLGSVVRTQLARQEFASAMSRMVAQVEADDTAHDALAARQGDGFATSVSTVLPAIASCLGSTATSSTKAGLSQLAGFEMTTGAPRDILPSIPPPTNEAAYLAAAATLRGQLAVDKVQSAETQSDTDAILITEGEVAQDLDAIGTTIPGLSVHVIAKDSYATKSVKEAYENAVADVTTDTTAMAPALASHNPLKISSAQSDALSTSLAQFATECKAVAVSSAANKPRPAAAVRSGGSSGYPSWHLMFWPSLVNIPDEFSIALNVNAPVSFGCTPTSLLAEGTATGAVGTFRTIYLAGSPTYWDIRTRNISATAVQWAVVECTKPR